MAERRMFTKKITDDDVFTSLPPTAQCLYFHLCMHADDDGFSTSVRLAMFNSHASTDDFNTLVGKRLIIPFDSGVIVIRHWRVHNYVQSDRKHDTDYVNELSELILQKNGVYELADNAVDTKCIQNEYRTLPEVSIDKNSKDKNRKESKPQKGLVSHLAVTCQSLGSHLAGNGQASDCIDKNSIDKNREERKPQKRFVPPSVEEVRAYIAEKGYTHVNADSFVSFYESKNWMVGKNKMVSWHSCVAGWEAREKDKKPTPQKPQNRFAVQDNANAYDFDELERKARERRR